jgi:hypothetical protein
MYVPKGFDQEWRVQLGSGGSSNHITSSRPEPHFGIVRVSIREQPNGQTAVWVKHRGGSSFTSLGTKQIEFLKVSQLPIERLGADGTAVVDRDEVATLVRISEPDAEKKPLLEIRFGSRQAFQNPSNP